ncbi:MAG: hypothetical protein IPL08_10510 [Saprospiraceae bacterium]|nr:hypothetical protein [Saprospiraceae bacterium]
MNPASYSFLNATLLISGVFAKRTWLTENNTTNKIWSGNLDLPFTCFSLRNPINEVYDGVKKDYKLGMSFTLMPHSFVNYNIVSVDSLAETGPFLEIMWEAEVLISLCGVML